MVLTAAGVKTYDSFLALPDIVGAAKFNDALSNLCHL